MKKILGVLAFSLLSLGVASASSLPCTIAGTALGAAVGSSTVVTCGGLTFDNFQVINATGGASGFVDLTAMSDGSACNSENEVCLSFNPNLQSGQDEAFLFTVTGSINQIDMQVGGEGASITELACTAPVPTSGQSLGQWINPGAFASPPDNIGRFGDASPGDVVGPGTNAVSMSLIKSIQIKERLRVQFGAQVANLFNHPNFAPPQNLTLGVSGFGAITAMQVAEGAGPRAIQLTGRITF